MDGITHHLVDFLYPDEDYTVADYKNDAENLIKDINNRDKTPIIVGGTGLYINSLIYELNFTRVEANEELRKKLQNFVKINGNKALHDKLCEIDPESAENIHKNDLKRVIRAIEINKESGMTMSSYNKNFRKYNDNYNLAMIGLNMDRQKLYKRINVRVDEMIHEGLIEEVKFILDMGYYKDLIALQGIGYKEIISYLEGESSLEEAIDLVKQKSRNYAKRQLTWFRREEKVKWFNKDKYKSEEQLDKEIIDYINFIFSI